MRRSGRYLLFVVLPACGLIDNGEPLVPFPADGAGAFQDAAPIEVCLGTARILAPTVATGATALCVSAEQALPTCNATTDCTGIEKCICGRCIVEPCQGGGACGENEVCRGKRCTKGCGGNSDCPLNERCISGGCARICQGNGDCHYGERCDALDDVCVTALCGTGGTCGAGSKCEAVAEIGELHEPAYLGDEPWAFVALDRAGIRTLHRASVTSPHVWRIEPSEPVLEISGQTIVGAPSVRRIGSTLELYAAVGSPSRIVRARSSDQGATFVVEQDPVLQATEAWENGTVGSPSVVECKGTTYLLYEGGDGAGIGVATITETSVARLSTTPLLFAGNVQDPIFWRQMTKVGAPHAFVVGDDVRIVFTGRGVDGFSATMGDVHVPAEANDSIGMATTSDMKSFARFPLGPMYARIVNLRVYLGESEPNMRVLANGTEMVFVSSDASGEARTGLVRVVGRGGKD